MGAIREEGQSRSVGHLSAGEDRSGRGDRPGVSGRQAVPSPSEGMPSCGASQTRGWVTVPVLQFFPIILALLVTLTLHGCAVVTVAGAAVSVTATAVSVTASAVETTVDVAAAGVNAVVGDDEEESDAD